MKFQTVAEAFNTLEGLSSRIAMTKELASLLAKAHADEARIICYFALGQLRAQYMGTQFNIAEKMMIPVIAQVLKMENSEVKKRAVKLGDLGEVVKEGEWKVSGDLTLKEVYTLLEDIEKISGVGSQEMKVSKLAALLKKVSPLSASYIVRIVLGKLRLGFSDMTILDALSWMEVGDKSLHEKLEHGYNISADIGLIAYTLKKKGLAAVEELEMTVGIPVRPAAAERMNSAQAIFEKLGECVAQPKIDGFRLQVHLKKDGNKVKELKFYSRNLTDMSYMFPDLADEIAKLPVKTLICEGEAVVYDEQTDSYLPFQKTVKRKRKHGIAQAAEEFPLRLFIFDILYLDGESYLHKAHKTRRKVAQKLIDSLGSWKVQMIEEKEITSVDDLKNYFAHALETGLEGLVIKKPNAHYQPGKRNFNWIKLKKTEEGVLADTLDCVILGYYYGKGKRAEFGIGAFLVGVYNKEKDHFETIAKVGTGLSDEGWKDLKKRCDALKVEGKPKNVICASELAPNVWIAPEIVCEIRADEITHSPLHTAGKEKNQGYALRFPRFIKYREEKNPEDTTTTKEIIKLYNLQFKSK